MKPHHASALVAIALASFLTIIMPATPAFADPTLGVPVAGAPNVGPPVEINECSVLYSGGWLMGATSGVKIEFTNDTDKPADVINFAVTDGNHGGNIRDVGIFAPGIEIRHRYKAGGGQMMFSPLFSHPHITCTLASVHFVDGTVWRPAIAATSSGSGAAQGAAAGASETLLADPSEVDLAGSGSNHSEVLTIKDSEKTAAFSYSDSCTGVATVQEISHNDFEIALDVTPLKPGVCALNVRNADSIETLVVIKVRGSKG